MAISPMYKEISNLKTDIAVIKKDIETNTRDISDIKSQLGDIQTQIKENNKELSSGFNDKLQDLKTDYASQMKDVKDSISMTKKWAWGVLTLIAGTVLLQVLQFIMNGGLKL